MKSTTLKEDIDGQAIEEEKPPLEDSFVEDLDIYGNPKHRYYNEEHEVKTKALRDKFAETYE